MPTRGRVERAPQRWRPTSSRLPATSSPITRTNSSGRPKRTATSRAGWLAGRSAFSATTTTVPGGRDPKSPILWFRSRVAGMNVLRNQIGIVEGLQIIGLDDWWAERFHPFTALTNVTPAAAFPCPQPQSGHGRPAGLGQLRRLDPRGPHARRPVQSAVFTASMLPVQNRRYTAGEFDLPRRPADVYQPRRRPFPPGANQRPAGNHTARAAVQPSLRGTASGLLADKRNCLRVWLHRENQGGDIEASTLVLMLVGVVLSAAAAA